MNRYRAVFLWGGATALALMGARAAQADEKSDALLREVETATRSVKTLTADLSMSQSMKTGVQTPQIVKMAATLKLKKPNFALIDFTQGAYAKTIASDGKNIYTLLPNNQYQKAPADALGKNIESLWAAPIGMFFSGRFQSMSGGKPTTTYLGKQTVEGTEYDVVKFSDPKPYPYVSTLYIAPNKLATRLEMELNQDGRAIKLDAVLRNVKTDVALPAAAFAYTPPKGATLYAPPSLDDYNKKLLPVGSAAPMFALSAPTGGKVELAEALKGKKAVLVNFWFYG